MLGGLCEGDDSRCSWPSDSYGGRVNVEHFKAQENRTEQPRLAEYDPLKNGTLEKNRGPISLLCVFSATFCRSWRRHLFEDLPNCASPASAAIITLESRLTPALADPTVCGS
jgi:hypothetical protein